MKTLRFAAFSVAASAALALCASAARADHDYFDFDSIDELASHVQGHSRSLAAEVRRQLPSDPSYAHVVADVNALYRQSARIHTLIHAGVNPADLCRDVRQLDQLVHHLQETLSDVHEGHSHFDPWYHTYVWHGPDMRNIRRLVGMIEDDTHELMDEVHTLESLSAGPSFSRPGVALTPGGIYLGGRGISVRLGR
jgi:hypothetical protein